MVAGNLHVELSELAGLVHEKKDFAWDELRRRYSYYDMALRTVRFSDLSTWSLSPPWLIVRIS